MTVLSGLQFTLTLDTLPDAGLVVVSFTGQEALSEPFALQLECASLDAELPLPELLNSQGTLTIWQNGTAVRRVVGIVAAATQGARGVRRTRYRLQLRSPLWRLQLRHNCRIFQGQTPQAIMRQLLQEHGITAVDFVLRGAHPPRDYCVQYRETDLAFLQRLAAEEGIFYFEEMTERHSRLCFADEVTALAQGEALIFNPQPHLDGLGWRVQRFEWQHQLGSTGVVLQDHSFLQPDYALAHSQSLRGGHEAGLGSDEQLGSFQHYDFPGRFKQDPQGKALVRYRLDALRQQVSCAEGRSNAPPLQLGLRWSLRGQGGADECDWQAIRICHVGQQPQALEEEGGSGATRYHNEFQAIPATSCWRPVPNVKPKVDGPQVARVVGPEGEEIYCDAHGRIKLQFPWDRDGQSNEQSSCWVRVSQGWAGGHYGTMALPRVGHEVIVSFLEGDPDQPIVTGRTYHATHVPPYSLPEHKSRTLIRTNSYQGDGFNEVRFEDQAGKEEIYVHGQQDLAVHVRHNVRWQIHNEEHASIRGHRLTRIGKNEHLLVEGERRQQIDGEDGLAVHRSRRLQLGEDYLLSAGREVHLKAGQQLVLDAGSELTLKAGGSFITLDASGITLVGPCIRLNSAGAAGTGTELTLQAPELPAGVGAPAYTPPPVVHAGTGHKAEQDKAQVSHYRFSE
jgi:type VI secretion system secreted protein VgrG